MGLDVSIRLIVGVPLKTLGRIEEETETVQLVTSLGKPTGQKFNIRRMYLKMIKEKFLIATNEDSIDRYGKGRMDFNFSSMFQDYKEADEWIHIGEDELNGTIIGLQVDCIATYPEDYSRYEQFRMSTVEQIQDEVIIVSDFLQKRFDYEGQIYVFAFASYSY